MAPLSHRKAKGRAFTIVGLNPNPTTVKLDDLLYNREANPYPAAELIPRVHSLEDTKDCAEVFLSDTNAVVANVEDGQRRRSMSMLAVLLTIVLIINGLCADLGSTVVVCR